MKTQQTVIQLLTPLTRPASAGQRETRGMDAAPPAPPPSPPQPAMPTSVERALAAFGARVLRELEPSGAAGLRVFDLVDRTGFDLDVVNSALEWLRETGRAMQVEQDPKRGDHLWKAVV